MSEIAETYLKDICEALGWQGGTVHQVIAEIRKLRSENEQLKAKLEGAVDLNKLTDTATEIGYMHESYREPMQIIFDAIDSGRLGFDCEDK